MTMQEAQGDITSERVGTLVQRLLSDRSISRAVSENDDFREVGLSSVDLVALMLSVEAEFNLTIPDAEVTTANFRSVATVSSLVSRLTSP
jgi:acyl carrier protein